MSWKSFGEKGRGRVSGVQRFWRKKKGDGEWGPGAKVLYFVLDSIKPVRFSPVQLV